MTQRQITTDFARLNRASLDLHRAMRAVTRARQTLARVTGPDSPRVVVAPELRWVQHVLTASRSRLKRIRGVVGFGLGRVMKDGKETGEPCITVFVRKKRSPKALQAAELRPLPRSLTQNGRRIRIDVVEIGALRLHAFVGASLGPTNDPGESEGTIGTFAKDRDSGRAVAISAMHVSGIDEFPNGDQPMEFSIPSIQLHDPHTRRLGVMTFGTRTGVDAAKIELDDPAEAVPEIPIIGKVQGWRPMTIPGDENLAVRMYGAASKLVSGRVVHPSVELPELSLDAALIVDIPTAEGDSGAALVDPQNHVLGFLVGEATGDFGGKRIFCSAVSVVNLLRVDF